MEFSTKREFDSLRSWEANTVYSCGTDQSAKKHMASFKQSILFSIPCNCVQYDETLVSGEVHSYTEEELNKLTTLQKKTQQSTFQFGQLYLSKL